MARIIKVQDAREAVVQALRDGYYDDAAAQIDLAIDIMTEIYERAIPEPEPKRSWWNKAKSPEGETRFICAKCSAASKLASKYCPNCGAEIGLKPATTESSILINPMPFIDGEFRPQYGAQQPPEAPCLECKPYNFSLAPEEQP